MNNAELIKALKDAEGYMIYVAPNCYASCEAIKAIRSAADAIEKLMAEIERLKEDLNAANDPCYECRGLGDDYYVDDDGELVSYCPKCWVTLRKDGASDG